MTPSVLSSQLMEGVKGFLTIFTTNLNIEINEHLCNMRNN